MEYCYVVFEDAYEFRVIGAFHKHDLALEAVEDYMARLEEDAAENDNDFSRSDCFFCDVETDTSQIWYSDYFGCSIGIDRIPANTLMV